MMNNERSAVRRTTATTAAAVNSSAVAKLIPSIRSTSTENGRLKQTKASSSTTRKPVRKRRIPFSHNQPFLNNNATAIAATAMDGILEPIVKIPMELLHIHIQCLQSCRKLIETYHQYNLQQQQQQNAAVSSLSLLPSVSGGCEPILSYYTNSTRTNSKSNEPQLFTTTTANHNTTTIINDDKSNNGDHSSNPLECLFRQMDETIQQQQQPEQESTITSTATTTTTAMMNQLRQQNDTVVASWLQSIHQYSIRHHNKNNNKRQSTTATIAITNQFPPPPPPPPPPPLLQKRKQSNTTSTSTSDSNITDVALAITKHLLQIILSSVSTGRSNCTTNNTNRICRTTTTTTTTTKQMTTIAKAISQKRAATLLLYQLLQKSSTSRHYFFCSSSSSSSSSSTDTVANHNNTTTRNSNTTKKQRNLLTNAQPSMVATNTTNQLLLLTWMDTITSFISTTTQRSTTMMANANGTVGRSNPSSNSDDCNSYYQQTIALQQESFYLLQSLQQNQQPFASLYPTLSVAVRRFQQQLVVPMLSSGMLGVPTSPPTATAAAPLVVTNTDASLSSSSNVRTITNRNMNELRQLRDLAIQHHIQFEHRIQSLLQQAETYLYQLVPRFGMDEEHDAEITAGTSATTTATTETKNHNSHAGNDGMKYVTIEKGDPHDNSVNDDEHSIDWEDGMNDTHDATIDIAERDHHGQAITPIRNHDVFSSISHLEAVEHTIATIQAGILYLQEDQMNIDFTDTTTMPMSGEGIANNHGQNTKTNSSSNDSHGPVIDNDNDDTKQKLQKIVEKLTMIETKHLSGWIYALTHADHLRQKREESVKKSSSPFVSSMLHHNVVVVPTLPLLRMLPSEIRQQQQLLKRLGGLEKELYSVLASSKQLGIQ